MCFEFEGEFALLVGIGWLLRPVSGDLWPAVGMWDGGDLFQHPCWADEAGATRGNSFNKTSKKLLDQIFKFIFSVHLIDFRLFLLLNGTVCWWLNDWMIDWIVFYCGWLMFSQLSRSTGPIIKPSGHPWARTSPPSTKRVSLYGAGKLINKLPGLPTNTCPTPCSLLKNGTFVFVHCPVSRKFNSFIYTSSYILTIRPKPDYLPVDDQSMVLWDVITSAKKKAFSWDSRDRPSTGAVK